jgi:hypothetical protein
MKAVIYGTIYLQIQSDFLISSDPDPELFGKVPDPDYRTLSDPDYLTVPGSVINNGLVHPPSHKSYRTGFYLL